MVNPQGRRIDGLQRSSASIKWMFSDGLLDDVALNALF